MSTETQARGWVSDLSQDGSLPLSLSPSLSLSETNLDTPDGLDPVQIVLMNRQRGKLHRLAQQEPEKDRRQRERCHGPHARNRHN